MNIDTNTNSLDITSFKLLPALMACANTAAQGELLRNLVFDQDPDNFSYGCYTTFDLRPWCEKQTDAWRREFWLDFSPEFDSEDASENAELGAGVVFECADAGVEACWYWDGDGTLAFNIFNRQNQLVLTIVNDDCKKPHRWIKSHAYHADYRIW